MTNISEVVKRYKKERAGERTFTDQSRKVLHRDGPVKEKYWFSSTGIIYPVEREHGDEALKIARALELIQPEKAISHYGFRSPWQLADGLFLKKGWLRVQKFESKTIGLNAKPSALEKTSTEKAVFTVLPKPRTFNFQEGWPYKLEYSASAGDYKRYGWKGMIKRARRQAILKKKKEMAEIYRYERSR